MTEQDLDRIEADLGIILPLVYRQLVCPFPIPTYAGNGERSSMSLWDSAEDLIRFNRELRMGSRFQKAWPAYMFALGRDGTGCTEAIDLRDPNHHVLWINCCDINQIPSDYGTSPSLNSWAAEYLENQRVMLLENGIDENSSPHERELTEELEARAGCRRFLFWVGGSFLVVLLIRGCSALL